MLWLLDILYVVRDLLAPIRCTLRHFEGGYKYMFEINSGTYMMSGTVLVISVVMYYAPNTHPVGCGENGLEGH